MRADQRRRRKVITKNKPCIKDRQTTTHALTHRRMKASCQRVRGIILIQVYYIVSVKAGCYYTGRRVQRREINCTF